jgi:hypothetical protein
VSTMTPYMAESLGAVDSITWVGTAAIITTIGSQMIVARCSDIFGVSGAMIPDEPFLHLHLFTST